MASRDLRSGKQLIANRRTHNHRRKDDSEHWLKDHWRPAMGWSYFAICLFDFIIGPIANGAFYAYTATPLVAWIPLTLQGGGLYHISMGAIIGITSYGRTKEKTVTNSMPYVEAPVESTPEK